MSERPGLQSAGNAMQQAKVAACPSLSHVSIGQASLATRSYSDLGPYNSALKGTLHTNLHQDEAQNHNGSKSAMDMVFFEQYNNLYRVTEVEVGAQGYYPCSYGGAAISRGGTGSWSLRFDPEVRRKGRLANYRAIAFEAKMKSSVKKSFKWFKHKCASWLPGHTTTPPPAAAAAVIASHV
ncbi:hypothetical protein GOP47_0026162 [Adiantum capillus-veneris]|uniref:Uncharacterized protein n=1 Tax=Adiantum capillus-veneris TaxID=13818 RepID=A0A9D4Z2N3_ADICA|nr:hypothetical protein GOP47_0026162 [Adiantum capillus-veneris]